MRAAMRVQRRMLRLFIFGYFVMLGSTGCAYRLPPVVPPSQEHLRILAKSPEGYAVHVNVDHVTVYQVPADGRLTLGIPSFRRTCGVYLFDVIKVGGSEDPLRIWAITVVSAGKTVQKVSLRQMTNLPTDPDGYHLLKIAD